MLNLSAKGLFIQPMRILFILFLWIISSLSFASDLNRCEIFPKSLLEQYDKLKIHQYQLENGLRVLVIPNDDENFFTMRLVYGVGSRDEQNGQSGYAHLVEHLMFKGTELLKDGEYLAQIQQAGGLGNASTDYDKTDYWAQLPLNYLSRAIWMEASRMRGLTLNQKNLENQLLAVKEEKALRLTNQPYLNPVSRFILSEWKHTPYRQLLIGSDEDLAAANLEKMELWLGQFYHPSNAVLAFTGKLNPKEVMSLVRKHFSDIPPGKKRAEIQPFTITQKAKSVTLQDSKSPWPIHGFAWQVPGFQHQDSIAIRVVNDILFNREEGVIYQQLVNQQLAFTVLRLDYAFQYIALANAVVVPHSYASAERIQNVVDQTLTQLKQDGVNPQQLCQVVNVRSFNRVSGLNFPFTRVAEFSNNLLLHNDPLYGRKQLQQLLTLTPEQIQTILLRYYSPQYLFITVEPDWPTRWFKSILEVLPDAIGKNLEEGFL